MLILFFFGLAFDIFCCNVESLDNSWVSVNFLVGFVQTLEAIDTLPWFQQSFTEDLRLFLILIIFDEAKLMASLALTNTL